MRDEDDRMICNESCMRDGKFAMELKLKDLNLVKSGHSQTDTVAKRVLDAKERVETFLQSTERQNVQGRGRVVVKKGKNGDTQHRSYNQNIRQGLKTEGVMEHDQRQMLKAYLAILSFKQRKENITYSISIGCTGCLQRNKSKARNTSL